MLLRKTGTDSFVHCNLAREFLFSWFNWALSRLGLVSKVGLYDCDIF